MTRLRADLLLVFAAAVWGLAFVFQKTAMTTIGPLLFIAARGSVAAAVLLPLAIFEYRRAASRSAGTVDAVPAGLWRTAAVAGLAFVTAAVLQQYGLQTATATNGGFLTALYVVLTPPLAFLLRGTLPSSVIVPAIVMSALGTWMLGGGAFAALSGGDWLIAACAIGWALHVILSESGSAFDRPILFTGLQFAVVAGVAAVGALLFEPISFAALRATAGEILYVGLLSSALTFTILTIALRYAPASEAAVIVSTESLFAALAGALLLGESLTPLAWLGAALIMCAVLLVQLGPRVRTSQAA
jgi:drug/metabolite transporter (DMT)-like permease